LTQPKPKARAKCVITNNMLIDC